MKFYGKIGFWFGSVEVKPGVWGPKIVERPYFGDVMRSRRSLQTSEYQNDDFTLNNQIRILSDLYAQQNLSSICYVVWNDVKWKVKSVELDYPRITLEIGGVYNDSGEETTESSKDPIPDSGG